MGIAFNIDFIGIHIHDYVQPSAIGYLVWAVFFSLVNRWVSGRIIKTWDKWYDKHPLSYLIFHHHIKGHEAKAAWLCDKDGCHQVNFDERDYQPVGHDNHI